MDEDRFANVTEAEREALRLLYDGLSAKEIGRALSVTDRAVYQRLDRAKAKMGTKTTAEAAQFLAVSEGRRAVSPFNYQKSNVDPDPDDRQHWLLTLLVPEANGRTVNDLTTGQRAVMMLVRAALVILILVGLAAALRELSKVLRAAV